ncbi:MAG: response regulator [Chromatiales bacterium]|nr:response regulator [Chromatiales bacterium]
MANLAGTSPAIRKILIADDSVTERLNLTRILEGAGYTVVGAQSGNEAKVLAEKEKPDAILLDIIMDDGDGYHACRAIRRNQVTHSIPVVMISSKSNPVDKDWAKKLGANGYVVKPYTDEEILGQIRSL